MKSLGIILVGESRVVLGGYSSRKDGIHRQMSKVTCLEGVCTLDSILEMMLVGDSVARGEWLVVLPKDWFSSRSHFTQLSKELDQTIGSAHIKEISKDEMWSELMDWIAVQYFSGEKIFAF